MLIYKMTNKEIKSFRRYTNFDKRAYSGLICSISLSLFIIGLIIYCFFNLEQVEEFGNLFYVYSVLLMCVPLWTFFYSRETLTKKKCFENKEMYLVRSKLNYIVDRNPTVNVSIDLGLFKEDEFNCSREIPTNIKSKLMTSLNTLYLKVVDKRQKDDIYEFPKGGDCYIVMYLDKEKKRSFFDLYTLDFSFLDNLNKKYKYTYTESSNFKKKWKHNDDDFDDFENEEIRDESIVVDEFELNEILEESSDIIKNDVENILDEIQESKKEIFDNDCLDDLINEIGKDYEDVEDFDEDALNELKEEILEDYIGEEPNEVLENKDKKEILEEKPRNNQNYLNKRNKKKKKR